MASIARLVVLLSGGLFVSATPSMSAGLPAQTGPHALLDVPYLAQTPELCGGAAVAMVLRYWGDRDVLPQDFAPLVTAADRGILTGTLATAVRERHWQAFQILTAAADGRARIQSEVDRGRPLIALIEVGPRTYHYVVIVGLTGEGVVLHDPARAPFRVLTWAEFDTAWTATGRWMLLVLPPDGFRADNPAPASPGASVAGPDEACQALVERSVELAIAGDRDLAERGFVAATNLCPASPAGWRELAGLRFAESRWSEARDLALSALRLAPDDLYAWRLAATSRFLVGDRVGALDAWNHADEPRIDTVAIHGAEHTRHPVVMRATGWQPGQLLTSEALVRALRRVRDLPVASAARVTFIPTEDGLAAVGVFLDERPLMPRGWVALVGLGARALILDELRVDLAGALGEGERLSAGWRWSAERPRVDVGLAVPWPRGFAGVLSLDARWERQAYDIIPAPSGGSRLRERRRRVGLHVSDWPTSWLWWQAGGALDRFGHDDLADPAGSDVDHLALDWTLDVRLAEDRVALVASAGSWLPLTGGTPFGSGDLLAAWRASPNAARTGWSATAGVGVATRDAPLAVWPGAGTGQGRPALLRAHPLLVADVMTGAVFGRKAAHASVEFTRRVAQVRTGAIAIAGFVDAARAWHRPTRPAASPLYLDGGVGLRIQAPGTGSTIRVDVAHGLRGGGTVLSAGWSGEWPR